MIVQHLYYITFSFICQLSKKYHAKYLEKSNYYIAYSEQYFIIINEMEDTKTENSIDLCRSKSFRLLNIYERLNKGEALQKEQLSNEFEVSFKTIQRDIDDLRAYLAEFHFAETESLIKYDRSRNCYYLSHPKREWITNKEAIALCKILLESRSLRTDELSMLIDKIVMQVSPTDQLRIKNIIRNEYYNYVPPRLNKKLLDLLWELTEYITMQKIIEFYYIRQDGKQSKKIIKPVSILFSEMYFYLIGFQDDNTVDYPIIFRIDRMIDTKVTKESFDIPYKERFNDGEFRKRLQFMYSGELKTVKFEYSGVLEALLDRLPTAKVLEHKNGTYIISAETYGDGIYMWLNTQGEKVRIIT